MPRSAALTGVVSTPNQAFSGDAYRGVRVGVLGASGFVGRWLARALCAHGADVVLGVRRLAEARQVFAEYGVDGEVVEIDLARPESGQRFCSQVEPSVVFNAAVYGVDRSERNVAAAWRINAELVEELCKGLAQVPGSPWLGQHLVQIGSALEYGDAGGNLSEDTVAKPATDYGRSKLAGTTAVANGCSALGIRGVTARPFTIYGPGEHDGRLLPSLLQAAASDEDVALTSGQQQRDFTYVEDVVEGLLRLGLAEVTTGEAVNLATGRLTSVRAFGEIAAHCLHIPPDRLRWGAVPSRPEEMEHGDVAIRRLHQLTRWVPPTTIAEGVLRTQAWAARGQRG